MKKTILLVLVLALGLAAEVANADFTFGTPTNLGPIINTSNFDGGVGITADGLLLFFASSRSGGSGNWDIWVTTRGTTNEPWGTPVNLGPTVNSSAWDGPTCISADGLELYFGSLRPGGSGDFDLWVTTRATISDPWGTPVNLGATVNSSSIDGGGLSISADGLELYFSSDRPGGSGSWDMWVTTRATIDDEWGKPVNLGPIVNSSLTEGYPEISADGLMLFFNTGTSGDHDLWVTTRPTVSDPWETPVNLGLKVNGPNDDAGTEISADGSTLYFQSNRPGGLGS